MQYRLDPKSGNQLSVLGFGCMRFPRLITGQIDYSKSEKLLLDAIATGVNYFDTAYLYGGSEEILGKFFSTHTAPENLRSKIFLATKLPHLRCNSTEDYEAIFKQQLAKLQTSYIDYYLIHNLSNIEQWQRLQALGIEEWIAAKKFKREIRQIGFSFHGTEDSFLQLLDSYDWDICQIQYNYMNENYQAGRKGLQAAAARGLPVVIMEPLLGGKLASSLPYAPLPCSLRPTQTARRRLGRCSGFGINRR